MEVYGGPLLPIKKQKKTTTKKKIKIKNENKKKLIQKKSPQSYYGP